MTPARLMACGGLGFGGWGASKSPATIRLSSAFDAARISRIPASNRAFPASVTVGDAAELPSAVLFPLAGSLVSSERNINGVRPPTEDEWAAAELEDQRIMGTLRQTTYREHHLTNGDRFSVAYVDAAWRLNNFERRIVDALDDADWVKWWHRNPPRKPFSVGIVKANEPGRFYPDFVVCLQAYPNARIQQRLIEPKESADDARQKMIREPKEYGRVFFLKTIGERIYVRDRTGQVADDVGEDLEGHRRLLEAGA